MAPCAALLQVGHISVNVYSANWPCFCVSVRPQLARAPCARVATISPYITQRVCCVGQMDVERRRRALLSAAGGHLQQARLQAESDLQAYCDALVQAVNRRREALTGLLAQIYRDRVSDIGGQAGRRK